MAEQRFAALEAVITGLTDQLNTFGSEVSRIVNVIDANDTTTKLTIQTDRDKTELRMNGIERSIMLSDQRVVAVEQEQIDIAQLRISPLETEVIKVNSEVTGIQNQVRVKVAEIETRLDQAENTPDRPSGEKREYYKSIMEHRVIGNLGNLTNDKSGFRDWRVKLRDALASVFNSRRIVEIMDWMENPANAFIGDESSDDVYALATNEGCDMPTQSDWMKWGNAILTMLTQKSENKSEAFLMVKRHKCGWMAWRSINKWYSATSGQGLSSRM